MNLSHRRATRERLRLVRARLNVELLEDRCLLDAGGILVGYLGGGAQVVKLAQGVALNDALASYRANPGVAYAEPDYQVHAAIVPNDPSFSSLYGLNNTGQTGGTADADIDAPEAWDITTGSTKTVVGVIDTGIDYTHIDLYQNVWINQGEIPSAVKAQLTDIDGDGLITFRDLNNSANQGAGKITDLDGDGRITAADILKPSNQGGWSDGTDADGNGYTDDLVGWNFVNNTNNPYDDNGHGSHVSGTIGAMGNNGVGVAGVNWNVEIAALKFLNSYGSGSLSGAISALNYAVAQGFRVTNNSWGGGGYSTTLYNAINNALSHGDIFVAAAGNGGFDGIGDNNDSTPSYPASYNLDNVIAVAATDSNDKLATFSNYGATSVDIAAPGVSILSTTPHTSSSPNGTYSTFSGTSMATPHVTGVVALVLSQHSDWSYSQVIGQVLNNADALAGLSGKVATGGRVNAYNAVSAGQIDTTGPRIVSAAPNASGANPVSSVRVTFNEAIDPNTFTTDDITYFTGPGNVSLTASNVTGVNGSVNKQFDISFAEQSTPGTYKFTVGPDITDTAGNLMDQNQNGTNGESADTYTVQFSINTQYTFTNSTSTPIRDVATNTSTIAINQDITIADLNVKLNISHTYDSDLYIHLRGPDNTDVLLVNRRGGSGDNFTDTVLDDQASTPISSGRAPFSGTFRPEAALSKFNGKNANGTWTLVVEDRAYYDVGTINSWSLIVEGKVSATSQSIVETVETGSQMSSDPVSTPATPFVALIGTPAPSATRSLSAPTTRDVTAAFLLGATRDLALETSGQPLSRDSATPASVTHEHDSGLAESVRRHEGSEPLFAHEARGGDAGESDSQSLDELMAFFVNEASEEAW